jgi:hypothetical protein
MWYFPSRTVTLSIAVLDGETGGGDCLPQALGHLRRLMAIE